VIFMVYNDYEILGKAIVDYCRDNNLTELNNVNGSLDMSKKEEINKTKKEEYIKRLAENIHGEQVAHLLGFCRDKTKILTNKKLAKLNASERMKLIEYFDCEPGKLSANVIEFWFNFNSLKECTMKGSGGEEFD
jgi:hypothetical protein